MGNENNGGMFILVRKDFFDRTLNTNGMRTKGSQETVKAFSSMITKRNRPKKIWVDEGPNLLERLECFVLLRG